MPRYGDRKSDWQNDELSSRYDEEGNDKLKPYYDPKPIDWTKTAEILNNDESK